MAERSWSRQHANYDSKVDSIVLCHQSNEIYNKHVGKMVCKEEGANNDEVS